MARAAFACGPEPVPGPPRREDEAGLSLSAGAIDVGKEREAAEVGVEHRFRADWCRGLGPHIGALMTTDESFYVYIGADRRFEIGRSWFLDSSLAMGFYEDGNGKDLGGALEFRSGISVGRRLRDGSRVGIGFFHLSNSSYYRRNPGANSLLFRWWR